MKFTMNTFLNSACLRKVILYLILFTVLCPMLQAAGSKQIEVITAEGGEIWQHDFNITHRRTGTHNYIVHARDRAGNESISGAFNLRIDPNAGLPVTRVVYPENNAIIRQNINILGVASGRFGVERVTVRLNNGDPLETTGTEYWNLLLNFSDVPDGQHSLYIQAFDETNTAGPLERIDFILDTTPPRIEMISHQIGDLLSDTVTIRGRASDPNGIRTLEYSEDGITFTSLSARGRADAVDFSIKIRTKTMDDGPMVFYLRAVDNTGVASVVPCLFFVDNESPELEIITPAVGTNVFNNFILSGRVFDTIGISRLYYEWGRVREDITMLPGDLFFSVPLTMERGSANSIKVTAVDKAGNAVSQTVKLEDRRSVKAPVLIIDYPPIEVLSALPADVAIYGRIAEGIQGHSVFAGSREVEARSSFRIDPAMLPMGRGRQSIRLTPVAADGTRGSAVNIRYTKAAASPQSISPVTVTSPPKYSWHSGSSFILQGSTGGPGVSLEFRFSPQDSWRPLTVDSSGNFITELNIAGLPHGPVHLELRTDRSIPLYHPFNRAHSQPEIHFLSPPADFGMIYGGKTVIGMVEYNVPIYNVAVSFDRTNYIDIPFTSRYGTAWFSHFCNFTDIGNAMGQLSFRITDSAGEIFDRVPNYSINPRPPIPTIIVNTPVHEEVFTDVFAISGVAFDQVGIGSVNYRILGPTVESISPGPAGRDAMQRAEAFLANPDVPFRQIETDQNFHIPIDFDEITDGEYIVEVYAADIYGVMSEITRRTIKVSTSPPETRVMYPVITRYNNGAILMRGFSSDANGVSDVSLSMDNGNTWQNVILGDDGFWEIALNTASYTDGIYSALLRTRDYYNVTSFSNAMVNIDNTPPELYLSSPVNGQHVGTNLHLAGRAFDNIDLKSLLFQIISAENPEHQRSFEIPAHLVIFENISLEGFPQGEYIIRVVGTDLADNQTVVSRKIIYDADDAAAQIAIFNPLPGEFHSGPISIVGMVTGTFLPREVSVMMNNSPMGNAPVDRYGVFYFDIPQTLLAGEGMYQFAAYYFSETGLMISSPVHSVYYDPFGPVLVIDSHKDGDVITRRPWLAGRSWVTIPDLPEGRIPRQQRAEMNVRQVEVSYDNGRSFMRVDGGNDWKFRLETGMLPAGPQPVVVRARFGSGQEAVRRVYLYVDTTAPQVDAIAPPERSVHRDNILVFGTASDNYMLADVDISLRPYNKFFYEVPPALRGMYFDVKGLGATYFDVGLGLSLFDDNVRLQGQFGIAPPEGRDSAITSGGRYTGNVVGIKLLANIFYLPFDYLFGPDWEFYSMSFAVGANFSWFGMDEWRTPLYMGAIIGQWDVANINFQYFNPKWKYFRRIAFYLQPELWFASSDVQAETIFRISAGMRLNWF